MFFEVLSNEANINQLKVPNTKKSGEKWIKAEETKSYSLNQPDKVSELAVCEIIFRNKNRQTLRAAEKKFQANVQRMSMDPTCKLLKLNNVLSHFNRY